MCIIFVFIYIYLFLKLNDYFSADQINSDDIKFNHQFERNSIEQNKIVAQYRKRTHEIPGQEFEGICQTYKGQQCAKFLQDQSVFVPPHLTQEDIEKKLTEAFRVISYSK